MLCRVPTIRRWRRTAALRPTPGYAPGHGDETRDTFVVLRRGRLAERHAELLLESAEDLLSSDALLRPADWYCKETEHTAILSADSLVLGIVPTKYSLDGSIATICARLPFRHSKGQRFPCRNPRREPLPPSAISVKSTSGRASRWLHRPMNRTYASGSPMWSRFVTCGRLSI